MSQRFWICITFLLTAFGLYEMGINQGLRALNDELVEACPKPLPPVLTLPRGA